MQTFITDMPANNYGVRCLDRKRLVKQLLECRQIFAAIAGETKGWRNHPATKMWVGHEYQLFQYATAVADEMNARDYAYHKNYYEILRLAAPFGITPEPEWFADDEYSKIMYTHRGRLHIKDPEFYSDWSEQAKYYQDKVCCDRCNYYWPSHIRDAVGV